MLPNEERFKDGLGRQLEPVREREANVHSTKDELREAVWVLPPGEAPASRRFHSFKYHPDRDLLSVTMERSGLEGEGLVETAPSVTDC